MYNCCKLYGLIEWALYYTHLCSSEWFILNSLFSYQTWILFWLAYRVCCFVFFYCDFQYVYLFSHRLLNAVAVLVWLLLAQYLCVTTAENSNHTDPRALALIMCYLLVFWISVLRYLMVGDLFFSSLLLFCIGTFPIEFQLLLCCMSSNNEEICDFYQFNLKCSFKRHSRIYICLMFLKLAFFLNSFLYRL